jgi:hypothetical protein
MALQVKGLEIRRAASYEDNPGMLFGVLHVAGDLGDLKIPLRPTVVSEILDICKEVAAHTAKSAAAGVSDAIEDAVAEPSLLEAPRV